MTWTPPPRPEWVRAINAGDVPPIAEVARRPFAPDALLAEARAELGLADGGVVDDFGDDAFVEPLTVLCGALEDEAALTIAGRWLARRHLGRLLVVKAQLAAWVRDHPAVVERPVAAPTFITGAPRTGTTLLHALLAADPATRVPYGWELLRPVPPLPPGGVDDARVALAEEELRLPVAMVESIDAIHVYGARLPKECISAQSYAFRSEEFVARYRVPSYQRWLDACDMTPAFDAHRLVLQVLQSRTPAPVRWVLKSPVYLQSLGVLWSTYPDATLVVTHRDPLTVLASVTSLVANLRWAHLDAVDVAELGAYHADRYATSLSALADGIDVRGPIHHVRYDDLVADPLAVVAGVYDALGWELTPAAVEAMRTHLAARPRDLHGTHEYDATDLGLDLDATRARFTRYLDRFHLRG